MVSIAKKPFVNHYFTSPVQVQPPPSRPTATHVVEQRARPVDAVGNVNRSVAGRQLFDAFLVLDVEATCVQGGDFTYPNEIIEWPVLLLKWKDRDLNGCGTTLEVAGQFRSFVRPTWRPTLSSFCTELTGITQDQVDVAPTFPLVLSQFSSFLAEHGLIRPSTGERLLRFCWCTDGPFDIRDFVVKQCFISNIHMPYWLQGEVMDVRQAVSAWADAVRHNSHHQKSVLPRRLTPNIPMQLKLLGLSEFEGREHSGIDDTRNVARIVTELARRGVRLQANTFIRPGRRWNWMGRRGEILEDYILHMPVPN